MLEVAPDAICDSAYGLGSDCVRTPSTVNALPGSRPHGTRRGPAMMGGGADLSDGWECAAVDDVFGAGDGGGAIGDEEGDEFGDLFGLGRSSERDPAERVHDLL